MKKFRDILETVYPPKPGDEKNFADKHIVDKKDYPNAAPGQFTSDKKKAKRVADYDEGDDKKVYEAATVHTKRADKEAVVVRAVDPKTGQSKARVVNRGAGEIKIGEETDLGEKVVNPYAVGMAAAMKQAGDKPPLKKSTIVKGHEIAKSIKKEAMDPVGKHDADIDNDGDTDKSDKYLIKRRKAIGAALKKEDVNQIDELSKKTLGSYIGKASSRAASDAAKYGMDTGSEKGLKHFNKAYDRLNNVKKAAAKLAKEEVEVDQIDEAFKVGAMHLEDGSSITLTREDVDMLNNLFNQLNSSNKSKMEQRLKSSKNGFNEIITFAKEVV